MEKLVQLLQARQSEFVRRLNKHIRPSEKHLYDLFDEKVLISERFILEKIKAFCVQISKENNKYQLENNLIGKLGEAGVKKYLKDTLLSDDDKSDRLTSLNCTVYKRSHGDRGKDFKSLLPVLPYIELQVKSTRLCTHNNLVNNLQWLFSEREINNNRLCVCTFSYQDIEIERKSFCLIIAGFLPREMILDKLRRGEIQYNDKRELHLKIQDLIHASGLLSYLLVPQVNKLDQETNQYKKAERLSIFYLSSELYQEALEQINNLLILDVNSYDAWLSRSACFFLFAKNKDRAANRKKDSYDDKQFEKEVLELAESTRSIPLIPDLLVELIYGIDLRCDEDLFEFIEEKEHQLYPFIQKQPRRITSRWGYDGKLYWQVIKDTERAITLDKERPEAYVNLALAYEQLSIRRKLLNLSLANRALLNYRQAVIQSERKSQNGTGKPLFYLYRGKAYANYANCGCGLSQWNFHFYQRALADLRTASVVYKQLGWIGNAEHVKSEYLIFRQEFRLRWKDYIGSELWEKYIGSAS